VIINVIFIHGLQGHPKDTWTYTRGAADATDSKPTHLSGLTALLKRKRQSQKENAEAGPSTPLEVFWPFDLLASDIKDIRILTYGYDSHVSKFFIGPANQRPMDKIY
jgi:hypothetical protein